MRWEGHGMHEEGQKIVKVLVGRKRPLERPRRRWQDRI
jgi:hypothetical protein